MFTVLSNTRNANLALIGAIAIMIAGLFTVAIARPLSNASTPNSTSRLVSPLSSPAFYEYRRGEWAPSVASPSWIGSPAFYEYRQGEWAPVAITSSLSSAAFYEYRQGEWSINLNANRELSNSVFRQGERTASLSPDLRDFANYQYRQGEWSGK